MMQSTTHSLMGGYGLWMVLGVLLEQDVRERQASRNF